MKKLVVIIMLLALCLTAFAGCNNEKNAATDLDAAGDYLFNLYKDDKEATPADFDVAGKIKVGSTTYDVVWTVDVTEGVTIKASEKQGFFTVDVNEKTATEITYTLTATITDAEGNTITKTFTHKIPAYKVFTYAEYAAAADDSSVVVKGIVTGIFSKSNGSSANGMYIQDLKNEGGYYVYGMKDDKDPSADLGIKIGMTVEVTGAKDTYNGTYEVVSASVEIVDSTIKTVAPVDYTEAFKNAEKLTDAALTDRQSMLVTLKGVEITGQDEKNGYYKFKLGELETYVRISSSNNCITKDEIAAFKTTHTEKFGYVGDVTGIVSLYSGSFYLIPATADVFTGLALPQRSDAEKAEMEIGNVTVVDKVTKDTVIDLPLTGSTYSDVKFAWTVDNACAVLDAATGKLTVTLPDEAATVTLTLTATCGNETKTQTFTIKVDCKSTDVYVAKPVENATKDVAYKFAYYQATLGKYLYFNGETAGYYFATTDNAAMAVDVYLEEVTGGVRFYFMKDNVKTYLDIYQNGTYINLRLTAEPTGVFTYDATLKTYVATFGEKSYYLGTYGDKTDLRSSETKYITGDNAANVGKTQYVANLAILAPAKTVANVVENATKDVAYKFAYYQATLGKYLYFNGETAGYYFGTTDNPAMAVDVYLEEVTGGVRFYFMKDNVKTYLDIYQNGTYINLRLTAEPTGVYTYDATLKTYVATFGEKSYYLGTYGDKTDLRSSETKYITGDNAANVGKTQYVANFATLGIQEVAPVAAETPAKDVAYKFAYYQATLGKYLYFSGETASYYFGTTDQLSKAVDVYLEEVTGGVRFYFMKDDVKTYLDIYQNGTYINLRLTAEPTGVYTYDATLKTYVATFGEKSYYLGTYGDKTDLRSSETKYITGDNAANVGKTQYVANLCTIEFVK